MNLTGVHLLLTYRCLFECDHCFVWGSPTQTGAMALASIDEILRQADDLGTVRWIYFEGGEPFLYYAVLCEGVRRAAARGFQVGVVTNGYWATSTEDALACLKPLAGQIQDLSVSSDLYHHDSESTGPADQVQNAAAKLGIPLSVLSIAQPEDSEKSVCGQIPPGYSAVRYRGRAAEKLASRAPHVSWELLDECPYEELREPGRIHVDPEGWVHLCQGLALGNLFEQSLAEICAKAQPESDPVIGPLLHGGPAELVRRYGLPTGSGYADACHLCYEARRSLRTRFPHRLGPDAMYGIPAHS